MLTHKIVTFRLPEKPFRAFLDDFDPKLNDPPMHRYPAPVSARSFDQYCIILADL